MDQHITILCSLGGVLNGSAYEGGLTEVLIVNRNITFDSLRNLITEKFSIDFDEFILVHIFASNSINLNSEQAWSFILQINVQLPYISIFVTPAPSHISRRASDNVTTNVCHGPSSSHQVISVTEEEHIVDDDNNDDDSSDDLVENVDDEFDNNDDNVDIPELFVGRQFENRIKFRCFISDIAIKHNFTCSATSNNAHKIIYKCNESSCNWRVYAKSIGNSETFVITTLENRHSCLCGLATGSHPLATAVWIKNKIIDKIRDDQSYSPSHVVKDIYREHRIRIKYSKAWKAREIALSEINGSYIDAYGSLERYASTIIETNPGSRCFIKTNINNSFERIYICFKACIDGFLRGCLPVISTDATFLLSRYRGILFIACAHDPNYQLYPIAYAVAESESTDSWSWFLGCFRASFERYFDAWNKISFISDKQKGLINAMSATFPESSHFFCIQHFKQNLKSVERLKHFRCRLDSLARCYNETDANYCFERIKAENMDVYKWIIGVEGDETRVLAHWITAYAPCPRLDINTSNLAECFNNWIKNLRDKPITTLLDGVRAKIITLQDKNRKNAEDLETAYCPKMLKTMARINREQHYLQVLSIDSYIFEIADRETHRTYVVRLEEKYCSCLRWYHTCLPCVHACFACNFSNINIESYYPAIFSKEALRSVYESHLEPIPVPYNLQTVLVRGEIGVPELRRKAGRPKKNRIIAKDSETRNLRCSICNGLGHNRRKCTNQPREL